MNLQRNMEKTYGLVWCQCSAALQSFMKGISTFEQESAAFNIIWLLTELKKATSGIDNKANAWVNMHDSLAILYKMKQGKSESNNHLPREIQVQRHVCRINPWKSSLLFLRTHRYQSSQRNARGNYRRRRKKQSDPTVKKFR